MYRLRLWSARNAGWLSRLYFGLEKLLLLPLHPVFKRIGYNRLDGLFLAVEKSIKVTLFDSKSCGQCALGSTGMSCPMNCPKSLRNGPCGGVRADGTCEIKPDMPCVWVVAWQGSQRVANGVEKLQVVSPPVDMRMQGTSAWLREVRKHHGEEEPESLLH